MDSSGISKKEYLKRYLGGGEKKKKKKKSTQSLIIKSKIVDDDIDLKSMKPIDEDELDIYDLAEEAPQIVGIIDERPEEVRLMSEFRSTKKWKIVADGIEDVKITSVDHRKTDEGSSRVEKEISIHITKNVDKKKSESDEPPPRSKKTPSDDVHSEIIKNIKKEIDSDSSPPRKNKTDNDSDLSPRSEEKSRKSRRPEKYKSKRSKEHGVKAVSNSDSDFSPPRKRKTHNGSDFSPRYEERSRKSSRPEKYKSKRSKEHGRKVVSNSDSDFSPPRKKKTDNDSDLSPRSEEKSRKSRRPEKYKSKRSKEHGIKAVSNSDSDFSPPRKRKTHNGSDFSPRYEERSRKSSRPEKYKSKRSNEHGLKVVSNSDSDSSPPRKKKSDNDSDFSPRSEERSRRTSRPEKYRSKRSEEYGLKVVSNKDSDFSPPRKRKTHNDSDFSPRSENRSRKSSRPEKSRSKRSKERGVKVVSSSDSDSSPPRQKKTDNDSDFSPRSENRSRRSNRLEKYKSKESKEYGLKVVSNNDSESRREKKSSQIEKTLSGKKAGLQSAEEMRKEGEKLRQREKEIFEKMSDDMTGRHATAIVRNRKTGRRHDAKEEARKKREEEEKEAEKVAQFAVWGKGVKQVQDRQDKIKDDLYEMSKPLARYKDDKDLEEMLKNQEREGDPMLEYIRKKKKTESSKPSKPEYEGLYFPNRYNIKPGHKWDGVDRSNGYEKKWFEELSAKKAREEEAFKWSTYDM